MRATLYKHALISVFVFIQINLFAQVVVNTGITPQNLVQNILAGSGVSVTNVTYTGNATSAGFYGCAGCSIGLNTGVILSSGDASSAANDASVLASTPLFTAGDAQLTSLLSGLSTFDAAVLEFDVTPFFDKLEIKFQFASEEYDEYVGLGFNDAMAIWISGPGISGNQNIALAPNTTSPVNINTINNGQTWSGLPSGPCTNCAYYHENFGGQEIVYDGYTYIITASQLVTPGNLYHIKIAIADAADHDFDSALLLGRNTLRSYSSTTLPCTGFAVNAGEDTTYCGIALPLSASVSTPGNYIYQWNTSYGMNDSTLQNPHFISDVANQQYIVTVIDTANNCTASDTVVISTFLDQYDSINVCNFSTPVILDAGIGATYSWSTGIFTQTISVNTAGVYFCTVTNGSGCAKTHTFNVMNNSFIVDIGPDMIACNILSMIASTSGGGGYSYSWSPVPLGGNVNQATQLYLGPFVNQVISVIVTDTITGCIATDQMVATIYVNTEDTLLLCNISSPVNLNLAPSAQNITWQYTTDPPGATITLPDTTPTISATQAGTYQAIANYPGCFGISTIYHVIDTCFLQGATSDYYWVGGQGNWSDTLHWATTSGGNIYQSSPPNALSKVYFDNNSGLTNADTCFIDIGLSTNDFNVNTSDTLRLEFKINNAFYSYGSILFNSPVRFYYNHQLYNNTYLRLNAISNNNTLSLSGTHFSDLQINGTGAWSLQDTLWCEYFTMNRGTLSTNGNYVHSTNTHFDYTTDAKYLYLGTSTFNAGLFWYGSGVMNVPPINANLFVDADSATIVMDSTGHIIDFVADASQYYNRVIAKGSLNLRNNCNIHSVSSNAGLWIDGRAYVDSLDVTFYPDWFGNWAAFQFTAGDTISINDYLETHVPTFVPGYFYTTNPPEKGYIELMQGVACLDSLDIQDIFSIGAGTIYAGTFSTDGGGNSSINFSPCFVTPAEYYWVGGNGSFDDTLHWATTSGGTIHPSSPPDYNSNIYFDNNSGLGPTDTVSVYSTPVVRDFNVNMNDTLRINMRILLNYTIDFSFIGNANIHTPVRMYINFNLSELGIKMMSGVAGNTVLIKNTPLNTIEFNGQGEWTLSDSLNADYINFKKGILRTDDHPIRINQDIRFDFGAPLTEQIYLGTSAISLGGSWYAYSANPNLFIDADSATIIADSLGFNHNFEAATNQHYYKIVTGGLFQFNGMWNIHSLISPGLLMTGNVIADSMLVTLDPSVFWSYLTLMGNDTLTVNNNIQINVLSGSNAIFRGNSTAYFNLLNGGACFDRLDISNITSIGAQVYAGVNSVDIGNNNGIIFGPCGIVQPYYWVGGTGNWNDTLHWATTSGGAIFHSTPPTMNDDVIFDANSFLFINDTVYGSPSRMDCKSFNASQVNTNATFFFHSDLWVNGSFLLSQYVNWHFNNYLVIYPSTDMNFNTSGIDLFFTNIDFFGNANEFVLDDIRTKGMIIADSAGTIYFNNVTVDAEAFLSNYLITLNLGTSVFNIQSDFTILDINGVAIVNGDSSFINVGHLSNGTFGSFRVNTGTYNYVNSDGIYGSPVANIIYGTYYDVDFINAKEVHTRARNFENVIWFVNDASTTSYVGKLIFDPVDTVLFSTNKFHVDTLFFNNPNGTCVLSFQDTVFVANQISANSSAGNYITLSDTTSGASVISKSSGDVCLDYVKLKNTIATGSSNFSAGANSIDLGGNTGWNFSACANLSNVWPGDANYDLIVNNLDFLNIGLAYGFTGPVRSGASLNYVAQPASDWSGFFSTGVNFKHADCNGDGLVDISDTTAIGLNYGKTHPARYSSPDVNSTNPNLSLQIAQDTVGLNETFYLDVNLADAANPVDSIYGLAFTLQTDATLIDTSQVSTISYAPSILGNFGNDLFSYEKNFFGNGYLDAAASRINHVNLISTYGTVGRLGIVTTDNIAAKQMIHVNVTSGYAVTANGTVINLNGIGDSVLLDPNYVGINEHSIADEQLIIYPNPSTGLVYLNNGNETMNEVQLTDSKGSSLNKWKLNSSKASVDLKNYQNGFYMLNVKCGDRIIHRKVNLMR